MLIVVKYGSGIKCWKSQGFFFDVPNSMIVIQFNKYSPSTVGWFKTHKVSEQ
jgi:hypothetical protein